jgi:hypothetical protein
VKADLSHNDILVGRLRQVAEASGATVYSEQPVRIGDTACYAGLVVEKDGRHIVGVAKQSYRRVDNDVRKAVALGAQLLLIVTPDSFTAQKCRRQLSRHPPLAAKTTVIACTLGAALEILRQALDASRSLPLPGAPHPKTQP